MRDSYFVVDLGCCVSVLDWELDTIRVRTSSKIFTIYSSCFLEEIVVTLAHYSESYSHDQDLFQETMHQESQIFLAFLISITSPYLVQNCDSICPAL